MEAKIVFTGPPNSGKTTAIGQLSDVKPVVTDVVNHDRSLTKERTTVGMDYGVISLDGHETVRLYGTPGQKRFDFMWRVLMKNAIGVAILVDHSQNDSIDFLAYLLDSLRDVLAATACVVGVGRMEESADPGLDAYCALLESHGLVAPVVRVDVRDRSDVLMLIELLLAQAESLSAVSHNAGN